MNQPMRLDTILLHAGQTPDSDTGSRALPIYQTSAYNFRDVAHGENLFSLKETGHIYSRLSNPTTSVFEERMSALEGGIGALAFASGHAAIVGVIMNLCQMGDNIVSTSSLYGGTYNMFTHSMPRMGITVHFALDGTLENFEKAITPSTKALYAETIGNPRANVCDIEALAALAHKHGIPLIIDATFTPYINRAFEFGADIVLHSATKFIGGHGTSMGGVVIDSGNFNYDNGKFPMMSEPDPSYHGRRFTDFGNAAFITRMRTHIMRDMGACISPFNSWLLVQGLETLHLRMERHCQNAQAVAEYLAAHDKVAWVNFPGLSHHPDNPLVKKYMPMGAGSIMSFGLKTGFDGGRIFIDSLKLLSHLANVGDAKSLVLHPASTSHSQLTEQQMKESGVSKDMIRLSIGIEDIRDIIDDIEQALDKV